VISELKTKQIIKQILAESRTVQAVYLFGSTVTEQLHSNSDIDLAIKSEKPISVAKLWRLSNELAEITLCDVDLIDLSTASAVMRIQIIAKGRRIYCDDKVACGLFEDFVFSDYARLNEERDGILEDIRQRGTVYG
jgi:predicted nucleotidyltransferase